MEFLTNNFTRKEIECKCGCGISNISDVFMQKLQRVREIVDSPIKIISGCRCSIHNKNVGGADASDHVATKTMEGHGVDIVCVNSGKRFLLVNAAIQAGFNRIGIAKSFIHLGDRESNTKNVIWAY